MPPEAVSFPEKDASQVGWVEGILWESIDTSGIQPVVRTCLFLTFLEVLLTDLIYENISLLLESP